MYSLKYHTQFFSCIFSPVIGDFYSVGYHTNTGCLAGIGKLPALRGWYFGWY